MRKAFTLIELLVVIAILALLAGIVMTSIGKERKESSPIANTPFIQILGEQKGLAFGLTSDIYSIQKFKDLQTGKVYLHVVSIRGSSLVEIEQPKAVSER